MRERRPGVWELRVGAGWDPARQRYREVSRTFHGPEKKAARALALLVAEIAQGKHGGTDETVEVLLDKWLDKVSGRLSPTTMREHRRLVEQRLKPAFGTTMLRRLRADDIDAFYRGLEREGLSPASVRRIHAVLHRALEQAVRWDWVAVNAAARADAPKQRRSEVAPPSPEDLKRVLAVIEDPALEVFVRLAILTGARRGELCGLRWSDVDFDASTLFIQRAIAEGEDGRLVVKGTKTHASRRIAIGAGATALLKHHREAMEMRADGAGTHVTPAAYIFSDDPDGANPWKPLDISGAWRRACRRAGVECRFHDLRHLSVTRLLAAGVDVGTVADRHGHRDASMTLNVYRHWVAESDRHAASALDSFLDEGDDDEDA